ncbi:MAG: ABC transporter permease subunit [Ilumatobacteraceae bacterium]
MPVPTLSVLRSSVNQYLIFALIGLGFGVLYAAIGMGVVITYRGTGVINFATGAMAMWGAYVFDELRKTGDLVLPVIVIPHRVSLGDSASFAVGFAIALLSCAALGVLIHLLVFRPLRTAPTLAKVVASVGVLIFLQALTVLQFGSESRAVQPIMPNEPLEVADITFPRDRLWLTLVVVIVAAALWAYFRYTRIGLATRASAESERTIALARYSPQLLAGATWLLSGVVVGGIGILASPTTVLNPLTYAFAIVPALAAALIGRLQSIAITVAAALTLGAFQSVVGFQTTKPWWPKWAVTGLSDAVPFIVIIVVLFLIGGSLPTRGEAEADPLPPVIRPKNRPPVVAALVVAGGAAIILTDGTYRFGVISSMIISVIMLSLVVLTGLIGQISLAQAAIAGVAGFVLSKLTTGWGVPFPFSLVLASLVASAFGVVVGIPALRIRGAQLAVVTLAGAVALEKFVFRNPEFSNAEGNLVPRPTLFGIDLGIRQGQVIARWQFGLVVLFFLTVTAVLVGNLARGATGRRFLAVRSNERAAASIGVSVAANKLLAFGLASFIAGVGGSLIGYSRGQLSADSFSTLVGLSFLAFAYLGGITSVSGALVAGTFAPLGITFVITDRLLDLGSSYGVIAGLSLVLTAIFNPEGIAGATHHKLAEFRARRSKAVSADPVAAEATLAADTTAPVDPTPTERRVRPTFDDRTVVLDAHEITVQFGGLMANNSVSLQVREGQVVGLIGPNGAGKTTFIDAITGFVPSRGRLLFDGQDFEGMRPHQRARSGLVRTWQSMELFDDLTVLENVRVAKERSSSTSVLLDLVAPNRHVDMAQVDWALDMVGMADRADRSPASLSLGQQKLLGVARAIASRPRVIMMDEPAAGLDSDESTVLGSRILDIADSGISVFLIDHDMGLVLDVCDYIYVLDFGQIIAEGTPTQIRSDQAVITAYLGEEAHA